MTPHALRLICSLMACSGLLAACGGGGGGGSDANPDPTPVAPPSSGAYAWILKAEGSTSALKYGLSLVHPDADLAEFVIEVASDAVTASKMVSSGTVDPATLRVGNLKPHTLLYIVGGDVRRVPLQANGQHPKEQIQRAMSVSACDFVIDANDHAAPDQSRYIVSTSGIDGTCNTADDGRAEVRLDSVDAGIVFTPITGAAPLAALRDPATLAPRGWVYPTEVAYWASADASRVALRDATDAITRVVSANYRSLLVESSSGLATIDFSGGTAFSDIRVTASAPSGWEGIGYDGSYHYAYRSGDYSTSSGRAGGWQVMRVSRATGAASVLSSGNGAIAVASLGREQIYLTIFGTSGNQLLRLTKLAPGATPSVLESGPSSNETFVITSGSDVHQRWRITGKFTSTVAYAIEMFDETGTVLFSSSKGGFQMLLTGVDLLDLNASENRTRFVFADGFGASGFGDATLVGYDTVARSAKDIGKIPGNSTFGTDVVFADVSGGHGSFMAGFAARTVDGVVQGVGAQVFSFDAARTSSLKATTQQQ